MQLNKEAQEKNSIQSYSDKQITIDGKSYESSVLVSQGTIISNWAIENLAKLNSDSLTPILELKPEVILIGHAKRGIVAPPSALEVLSKEKVGIECMSIGAACRTYNILLGEYRKVVLGLIISSPAPR